MAAKEIIRRPRFGQMNPISEAKHKVRKTEDGEAGQKDTDIRGEKGALLKK